MGKRKWTRKKEVPERRWPGTKIKREKKMPDTKKFEKYRPGRGVFDLQDFMQEII